MITTPFGNKKHEPTRPAPPVHSVSDYSNVAGGPGPSQAGTIAGVQNPAVIYQHIQDMSAKRIATLDYLRKAHEGRVYWFNALYFNKQDLSKMPYFEAKKVARRATNYLLLGLSLPTIAEATPHNPLDYLRSLHALLVEFDTYQQVHPLDGSSASSLSRARLPSMFKRATHVTSGKGRRASSATDIGLPMSGMSEASDGRSMTGTITSPTSSTASSFPASDQELLPGEDYTHLLTPSLPFEPDFYETFATLCDVLIDCYTRVMNLANTPLVCGPSVGEMFAKADSKVRKIILGGVVKEFEEASRSGVKAELGGVGKVVLGGLL